MKIVEVGMRRVKLRCLLKLRQLLTRDLKLGEASDILVEISKSTKYILNVYNLEWSSIKMAGLVTYASSDEEDEVQEQPAQAMKAPNVSHCALHYSPE